MLHFVVNLDKWQSLPKHYQAVVAQACDATNTWMLAKYDSVNAPALKRLIGGGAIVRPFPPEVMDACYKAAQDHYQGIAAANPLFKKALGSLKAYKSEQLPWWQIARGHQLRHDEHAVHRGPDLVTHCCEEIRFRSVCAFGGILCDRHGISDVGGCA